MEKEDKVITVSIMSPSEISEQEKPTMNGICSNLFSLASSNARC